MVKAIPLLMDNRQPTRTASHAADFHRQMRKSLEDVKTLMGDTLVPPDYHTAFFNKTNELLRELERRFMPDV
ncbi:hypothetical protein F4827_001515 [Paraburkholderia bannensis]|uniref:Uncharacterized protein n=1 Tax=Paraburkholderia bannensis TaxID=765414 RepID=A0A7W9WRV9_9BURK|nr:MULTISPECIES: hypothetical protein [Paraburkholderia]MBB3256682.1 hypothetical protein [Paraburkholderia sp. WP4_3_2]MBB6101681.1 hypothetical protein [Paraburkholderia bannensis]